MKTALIAAVVATLAFASTASANEYVVYSCKTPSGAVAPTDGWSKTGVANYPWWGDNCKSGGSLDAGMLGTQQASPSARVGWGFDSGAATIRGYSIDRGGRIDGTGWGVSMELYDAENENDTWPGHVLNYCNAYYGCKGFSGVVTRTASQLPAGSHRWFFSMACNGYVDQACVRADSAPNFGDLHVRSAAFTLEDGEQPSATAAAGSLTAEGASAGVLTFVASDAVSGIARATIEADGAELVSIVPNSNNGRCQRLGQAGGANDYLYLKPCPSRQQVELTLPRDSMTNGEHIIRARAYDAAGNAVTAFGPRRIEVRGSKVSGLSAARLALDGGGNIVASHGDSARINGTLFANTGEPISGARIEATLDSRAATHGKIVRVVHTDGDGRFSLTSRATGNRTIALINPETGARATGKLKVRSRIKLRTARRKIPSLGRMRLSGQIPGERARHGASVAIKAKSGHRWRTVGVVRTSRDGRFKFDYRFTRTRHATLRFRAVALKSSDLTVSPTPSKSLRVRVG